MDCSTGGVSRARVACGAAALALSAGAALAQSGEPIKIGFSMSLTGPLAANGKMSLVAMKIWEEDINKPRAGCSAAR